jgi:hypothetical protein
MKPRIASNEGIWYHDSNPDCGRVNRGCYGEQTLSCAYMQGGVVMDTESTTTKNAEKSLIIARNNLNHMYPSSTVSPLF